jgi:hypothetical protein
MAPHSEVDELSAAWRALEGSTESPGWRTIPIAGASPLPLLAGRHLPDNDEALLVGFACPDGAVPKVMPKGFGFEVGRVSSSVLGASRQWLSLRRHRQGRLDLFTMMASDVLAVLRGDMDANDEARLSRFLARVRAWQDFMRSESDGLLSPEAEIGLHGELEVLGALLAAGVRPDVAVSAWKGPLDGLHDFVLEMGAVEVKTATAPSGFPALIGSIEQLDDSLIRPLFLAAVRVLLDSSGDTLPQRVSRVRGLLLSELGAVSYFDTLLLHAGYSALLADRYTRRLVRSSVRLFEVSEAFPRIIRRDVHLAVRRASYEIDVDLSSVVPTTLEAALRALGVPREWS